MSRLPYVIVGALAWAAGCFAGSRPAVPVAPSLLSDDRSPAVRTWLAEGEVGMVPVGDGKLLLWRRDGHVQIGTPDAGWGPIVPLPLLYATTAIADGRGGALVLGAARQADRSESATVVGVDTAGAVTRRWTLPGVQSSIAMDGTERLVVASDGLFSLRDDGSHERMATVPRGALILVDGKQRRILCVPADRTRHHEAPARCRLMEASGWDAQGTWTAAPIACGGVVFEPGRDEVVGRRAHDGAHLGRVAVKNLATIACRGDDAVVLGAGTTLSSLSAKDWHLASQSPCGSVRIRAVATQNGRAACLDERGAVMWGP